MTLRFWVVLIATFVFGAILLGLTIVFQRGIETYSSATSLAATEVRAQALGAFVARTFYEEWKSVEAAALRIDPSARTDVLRTAVSFLAGGQEKATWVGIARTDGTVVAGTNGAREGTNVSDRTWFQRGLEGPFAGDVHESEALTRILEPQADQLLRFVDFSAPVYTAEGSVYGVLGVLVNWRWVRAFVAEAANELNLDAFIVNRAGTIILGTDQYSDATAELASFQAAARQAKGTFHETWPDGKAYFTAAFPEHRHETLPPFGWSIVVRLDPGFVVGAETDFRIWMRSWIVAAFILQVILMALLIGVLIRPLSLLAQAVLDIAKGEPVAYIREYRRFAEVRKLSEAMVRLQSRNHRTDANKDAPAPETPVNEPVHQ